MADSARQRSLAAWRRLPRSLRWSLPVMLILALVLGLAEWNGWRFLRAPIEQRLSAAVGAPVRIDEGFELRLLRPRPQVFAPRVEIDSREGFGVDHLLLATELRIVADWRELWRWRMRDEALRLPSIAAGTLDARLVRLDDGSANWRADRRDVAASAPDARPLARRLPRPGLIDVPDGRITIVDRPLRTELLIELQSSAESVHTRAPRGSAGPAFGARITGRYRELPLRLEAQFAPVFEGTQADAAPQLVLRLEGEVGRSKLRFDGALAPLSAGRVLHGEASVSGPSLAAVGAPLGLTLPTTPPFEVAGRLQRDGDVWHFEVRQAKVGSSSLAGDFRFDTGPEPPRLVGTLRGRRLALVDLGPAIGTQPRSQRDAERVLPARRFDIPSLRKMDADVALDVAELDFGSAALAPFESVRAKIRLAGGVLDISDLRARVGDGQVSGRTRLDGRGEPAQWSADLELRGVEIEDWIKGVRKSAAKTAKAQDAGAAKPGRAKPVQETLAKAQAVGASDAASAPRGSASSYLTGELLASVKVTGSGRSTAEILASLNGKVRVLLQDGTLSHLVTEAAGLDIAQALGVAMKGDEPLPLRCARVDLLIDHGVATPTLALLDNRDSTVRIEGKIDLRDESLALRATVRPKDFSPLALRAPLIVTGHLADPKVGVEGTRLLPRVLAAIALGFVAPPAAVLPLVDPGSAPARPPCAG